MPRLRLSARGFSHRFLRRVWPWSFPRDALQREHEHEPTACPAAASAASRSHLQSHVKFPTMADAAVQLRALTEGKAPSLAQDISGFPMASLMGSYGGWVTIAPVCVCFRLHNTFEITKLASQEAKTGLRGGVYYD
ncbi:hypothetical protein PG994_011092 [Apiospora phragmitis]|uniref:Uncharacterized protein n=1 Tax=Apiospora phragmitis TaxID=2905665 RepID=A0ABR1TS14_9PEZI